MRTTLLLLFYLLLTNSLSAKVIHVDHAAIGSNDGTSWPNAFTDLNNAISSAEYGDSIWVAQGTYYPTTGTNRHFSFLLKNGVSLFGGFAGTETSHSQRDWDANLTVLSGDIGTAGDSTDNSHTVVLCIAADSTTVFDCFTVSGGNADSASGNNWAPGKSGGGMYIRGSTPGSDDRLKIRHCTFLGNHAHFDGGGLYVRSTSQGGCAPIVDDCRFINNTANEGGGVYLNGMGNNLNTIITETLIAGNFSDYSGGGMSVNRNFGVGDLSVTECDFIGNSADNNGGGLNQEVSIDGGITYIDRCRFEENAALTSAAGGAINVFNYVTGKSLVLSNTLVKGNFSNGEGSFLAAIDENLVLINLTIEDNHTNISGDTELIYLLGGEMMLANSIIRSNFSSGRHIGAAAGATITLINCTFTNNTSFGFSMISALSTFTSDYVNIHNTVFWSNLGFSTLIHGDNDTYAIVSNTLSDFPNCTSLASPDVNLTCGPGNLFNIDPMFVDTAAGDFRLLPCSPAINAGDNTIPLLFGIDTDITGAPRIQEDTVDMGAHEYGPQPFAATVVQTTAPSCEGGTGGFTASVTGGCAPYTVQFSGASTVEDTAVFNVTGLPAGTFNFSVTDVEGRSDTFEVDIPPGPSIFPMPVATPVTCHGLSDGTAAVVPQGFPPFAYEWAGGQTDSLLTGLPAGSYPVTVTDSLGCEGVAVAVVASPDPLTATVNGTDSLCFGSNGGHLAAVAEGGTLPYTFDWAANGADSLLSGIGAGSYSLTLTDGNGCTATAFHEIFAYTQITVAAVIAPANGALGSDGCITLAAVIGGVPGYSYLWDNGDTTQNLFDLPPGDYGLTVTDALGCIEVFTFTVDFVDAADGTEMPAVSALIAPNPSGARGAQLFIRSGKSMPLTVQVFDGAGKEVYFEELVSNAQNQIVDFPPDLSVGIYWVVIEENAGSGRTKLKWVVGD